MFHSSAQMPNSNNPYAGAGAYSKQSQASSNDPREVEALALLNAARKLQALQGRWSEVTPGELEDVLRFNRQIWMMFVDTAVQNANEAHSVQLRTNIANLGMFVFKRSMEVAAAPESRKLDALININREIAAGLMTKPQGKDGETAGGISGKPVSTEI